MKPWWKVGLGVYERFASSAVAYHFLEGARMMSKSRPCHCRHFFPGVTYLCLHRTLVHMITRTLTYPSDWPAFLGVRQMEYAAESRFEAKRRLGPPHKPGPREWVAATHADHMSQVVDAIRRPPTVVTYSALPMAAVRPEDMASQNALAMRVAMRLLALCCPCSMPGATREDVNKLAARYQAWWKGRDPPLEQDIYKLCVNKCWMEIILASVVDAAHHIINVHIGR